MYITVKFNDAGQAEFDFNNVTDEQIFTALLGIESYIGAKSDVPVTEIRSIMDEMKEGMEVKDSS